MAQTSQRTARKKRVGRVVSNRMEKTAVVAIEKVRKHPLYPKFMRKTEKYKAHDEKNETKIGDLVEIMETRPVSKEKRWRITKIIEKAK